MESLVQKCKKVISNNINLQKTNNLPNEGLAERTILEVINELKEKNEKEYVYRLKEEKQNLKEFYQKHYDAEYKNDDWPPDFVNLKIKKLNWAFFIIFYEREFIYQNFLKKANYDIDQAVVLFWFELSQFTIDYIPDDFKWDDDLDSSDSDDSD